MRLAYFHDDEKATVFLDLPDDLAKKVEAIQQAGFHFEIEPLPKGLVDVGVYDATHELSLAFVICAAQEADTAVQHLITNFNLENPYV